LFLKLKTYWRLGLINIARVVLYRLGLIARIHPVTHIKANIGGNEFFKKPSQFDSSLTARDAWENECLYFGRHKVPLQKGTPTWLANPFNGKISNSINRPWWKISDFNQNVGDIKTVWEPSRFDWVLALSQRIKAGHEPSLDRLNLWLSSWCKNNPAYYGPNWKCGQETSIRVQHLAMASRLLGQPKMCIDLAHLVEAHLLRIYPTVSYALAQDNNHGISEAAALFIGGSWCEAHEITIGKRCARRGLRLLENLVKRLIAPDGSFSQYSLNYHRVLIDTLCMVEVWRRWWNLDEFSPLFYQRAKAAIHWLFTMVEPKSGDAPNLGANDGALLLPLTNAPFRDFRPSVQLSKALFEDLRAYRGETDTLRWLNVDLPKAYQKEAESQQFDDGGYAVLRRGKWMAVLKYPRYRFRPRHCDALHVDLWIGSNNLLRDGGSYSYNTNTLWHNYFTGTAAHNTIQFDGRDQMPHVGRFLRGAWLATKDREFGQTEEGGWCAAASYFDWKGCFHHRKINLQVNALEVCDTVKGFVNQAVLRWRLQPGDWSLEGKRVRSGDYNIRIGSDVPIVRCELINGWESRHYLEKTPIPVLEIEIQKPGKIISEFYVM